jgi:hypothetical protein
MYITAAAFFRELESENLSLQEEYQHLKASSASPTTVSGSAPHSSSSSSGLTTSCAPLNGGSAAYLMSVPALSSDAEILQVSPEVIFEHLYYLKVFLNQNKLF